jgi:hypothetical protein
MEPFHSVPGFAFPKQGFNPDLALAHCLLIGLAAVVATHKVEIAFIEMTLDHAPLLTLGTFGFECTCVAAARIGLIDNDLLSIFGFPPQ